MTFTQKWTLTFDQPELRRTQVAATDLSDAVEKVFGFPADGLSFVWGGTVVRVPYRYGLSDILNTVLDMLEALVDEGGRYNVSFSNDEPNSLDADWYLSWEADNLVIESEWRAVWFGMPIPTLQAIAVSRAEFLRSWLGLLSFLRDEFSYMRFEETEELARIARLAEAVGV